ncbi:hypothetical protein F5Y10DRAFT_267102 [Nemania abortiva]|nr:hypothetical protein F5Y10DRAFT_267102 [Nemania abortiva]
MNYFSSIGQFMLYSPQLPPHGFIACTARHGHHMINATSDASRNHCQPPRPSFEHAFCGHLVHEINQANHGDCHGMHPKTPIEAHCGNADNTPATGDMAHLGSDAPHDIDSLLPEIIEISPDEAVSELDAIISNLGNSPKFSELESLCQGSLSSPAEEAPTEYNDFLVADEFWHEVPLAPNTAITGADGMAEWPDIESPLLSVPLNGSTGEDHPCSTDAEVTVAEVLPSPAASSIEVVPQQQPESDLHVDLCEGSLDICRPLKCSFAACSSKVLFTRPCDLAKHYRQHFRRFFCRVEGCSSSRTNEAAGFATKKDRLRHEATHDPSIVCEGCGKKFSRHDNLRDHERRLHGRNT